MPDYQEDLTQEFKELLVSVGRDVGNSTVLPVVEKTQALWAQQMQNISENLTTQQDKELKLFHKIYQEIVQQLQNLSRQVEKEWGARLSATQNIIETLSQTSNQNQYATLSSVNAFESAKKNLQGLAQSLQDAQNKIEGEIKSFKKDFAKIAGDAEISTTKNIQQIQKMEEQIKIAARVISASSETVEKQILTICTTWDSQQKSSKNLETQSQKIFTIMQSSAEHAQKVEKEIQHQVQTIHVEVREFVEILQNASLEWEKNLQELTKKIVAEQEEAENLTLTLFSNLEQNQKKVLDTSECALKILEQSQTHVKCLRDSTDGFAKESQGIAEKMQQDLQETADGFTKESQGIAEKMQQDLQGTADGFTNESQNIAEKMRQDLDIHNQHIQQIHKESQESIEKIGKETTELCNITHEIRDAHNQTQAIFIQFQQLATDTEQILRNSLQELTKLRDSLSSQIETSFQAVAEMGKKLEVSQMFFETAKQSYQKQQQENMVWWKAMVISQGIVLIIVIILLLRNTGCL